MLKKSLVALALILGVQTTTLAAAPWWVYVVSGGWVTGIATSWWVKYGKVADDKVTAVDSTVFVNEAFQYVLPPKEKRKYNRLATSEEKIALQDSFWTAIVNYPEDARGLKDEFRRRTLEAVRKYSGHQPGWQTDKGRILILYGRPSEIERDQWATWEPKINGRSTPTAIEAWLYNRIQIDEGPASIFDGYNHGQMQFIFAEMDGGMWQQVYSNVPGEIVDPQILKTLESAEERYNRTQTLIDFQ